MRAMVYESFGGPVDVRDVRDPEAPDGGVVIRVGASGLCRSDWHAWAGHDDSVHLPHVPGHEFSGTIESVGTGVTSWRAGQRVTAPFVNGCGKCVWCLAGQSQVCPQQTQPGFTHWGSHAELVTIRAAELNVVAVPDTLSDDAAASLGCRFATAYRAVRSRANVRPDEWIAVFGAGGVGLSAIMIAAAVGARVIAVDRNPAALDLARSVGAEHVILASAEPGRAGDPGGERGAERGAGHSADHGVVLGGEQGDSTVEIIAELTGGGANVSIDAVGSPETSSAGVRSLRRRGRHVQIGLLASGDLPVVPLDRILAWELDVLGSHGMSAADYPAMLDLVARGDLRPQDLVRGAVDLETGAHLLPRLDQADPVGITVVHP